MTRWLYVILCFAFASICAAQDRKIFPGRVGIGTNGPTEALHVHGKVKLPLIDTNKILIMSATNTVIGATIGSGLSFDGSTLTATNTGSGSGTNTTSPAGVWGEVQYNSNGVFGASGLYTTNNGLGWRLGVNVADPNGTLEVKADLSTNAIFRLRDFSSNTVVTVAADGQTDFLTHILSHGSITAADNINSDLNVTALGFVNAGVALSVNSLSQIRCDADNTLRLRGSDNISPTFDMLLFGQATASFPALKVTNSAFALRLGDDSDYADLVSGDIYVFGTEPAAAIYFNDTNSTPKFSIVGASDAVTTNNKVLLPKTALPGVLISTNVAGATNQIGTVSLTAGQYLTYNGSVYVASNLPSGSGGTEIGSIYTNNVLVGSALTELGFTNSSTLTWTGTTNAGRVTVSGTVSGFASSADIQIFTNGGAATWTKPANAKFVMVSIVGGGGGGGSGRKGAAGTVRCGGGGGGGGGMAKFNWPASVLGSTETVTVGGGGVGGAAQTVNSTDGNTGANGTNTTFGSWLRAQGGSGGSGGTATSGGAGAGGSSSEYAGANGAAASTSGGSGNNGSASATYGAAGAGSGGGLSAADANSSGGNGASAGQNVLPTAISGGTGGSAGSAGNPGSNASLGQAQGGGGGGGGGSSLVANGGAGGAGGLYGGGAGGGGAALDAVANSGAGGTGGTGIAVVVTVF